nr:MAG TPA: hypothetical protein [Caudoviricetes sp.]
MNNRRNDRKPTRLERIEKKCDLIISELALLRRSTRPKRQSVDEAIDRLHESARRMRIQSEKDARLLRKAFQFK